MGNHQKFAEAVKRQIEEECELSRRQQESVLEVLRLLYESISARATIANAINPDFRQKSPQHAGFFYQIQQIIRWTPLRFFLKHLAEDLSLVIRAAAKGELFEREGSKWADHEESLMESANLAVMYADPFFKQKLMDEVGESELIYRAFLLWQEHVERSVEFTPGLLITRYGPSSRQDV